MLLVLVRHGENNWVKEGKLAGWLPGVVLNERGHQQAQFSADALAHLPVAAIFSSPLERCWETATKIAQPHGLTILPLPALGEVRYGAWQGMKIADLAQKPEWRIVQNTPSRFCFPDGESFCQVQQRAIEAIEHVSQQFTQKIVICVSHADVIKLVLAHYLGMHIDQFQRLGCDPASISAIYLGEQGEIRVICCNDHGPLSWSQPTATDSSDPRSAQEG